MRQDTMHATPSSSSSSAAALQPHYPVVSSATQIRVQPQVLQEEEYRFAQQDELPVGVFITDERDENGRVMQHPSAAVAMPASASSSAAPASSSSHSQHTGYFYWQHWPGRNRPFACFGHIVLLADNSGVLTCNILMHLIFTGVFCWGVARHIHIAVIVGTCVIMCVSLYTLLQCTFTEAGIIPRRTLDDYPNQAPPGAANGPLHPPPTSLLDGNEVPLKWCRTCCIYRPLRSSHCRECDCCVEEFDHHCPWVCNCVGKRNYRYFVSFLFSAVFLTVYILFWSMFLLIYESHHNYSGSFSQTVSAYPVSIIMILLAFLFGWCLISLFGYHAFLIWNNMTTNEFIKKSKAERAPQIPYPLEAGAVGREVEENGNGNANGNGHRNGNGHNGSMHSPVVDPAPLASSPASPSSPSSPSCCTTLHLFFCSPLPPSHFSLSEYITPERVAADERKKEEKQRQRQEQQNSQYTQFQNQFYQSVQQQQQQQQQHNGQQYQHAQPQMTYYQQPQSQQQYRHDRSYSPPPDRSYADIANAASSAKQQVAHQQVYAARSPNGSPISGFSSQNQDEQRARLEYQRQQYLNGRAVPDEDAYPDPLPAPFGEEVLYASANVLPAPLHRPTASSMQPLQQQYYHEQQHLKSPQQQQQHPSTSASNGAAFDQPAHEASSLIEQTRQRTEQIEKEIRAMKRE